ncbi:unnamed protein product [Urochloa humidicola]
MKMDPLEKKGSQQKKSPFNLQGSIGAPTMDCTRTGAPPPGGLGAGCGALDGGSGAAAPSSSSGTSRHQAPGSFWAGMSLGGSFMMHILASLNDIADISTASFLATCYWSACAWSSSSMWSCSRT